MVAFISKVKWKHSELLTVVLGRELCNDAQGILILVYAEGETEMFEFVQHCWKTDFSQDVSL